LSQQETANIILVLATASKYSHCAFSCEKSFDEKDHHCYYINTDTIKSQALRNGSIAAKRGEGVGRATSPPRGIVSHNNLYEKENTLLIPTVSGIN
jgi:hypothetical protein